MHITPTMILFEDMKLIEHVLPYPICVRSYLTCACKHCSVTFIIEHVEAAD